MTGVDLAINDILPRLANIPYLNTAYGRATIMQEIWGDKSIIQIPKVYAGGGEYVIPLPKDNQEPMCFFQAVGAESYGEFDRFSIGEITRKVAITFWGKLGKATTPNYIDDIKFAFIEQLQASPYVKEINSFVDEKYQDVFPDFHGYFGKVVKGEKGGEQQTQWLMEPYGGFRMVFTISYTQQRLECL